MGRINDLIKVQSLNCYKIKKWEVRNKIIWELNIGYFSKLKYIKLQRNIFMCFLIL